MLDIYYGFLYYKIMKKQYECLCLNKSWYPIHIVSWKRAVSLLYQGSVRSLDMDFIAYDWADWLEYTNLPEFDTTYYNYIHSSHLTVAVPDLIVLKDYNKLPMRDVKCTRENIFSRDGHKCAYCGKQFKRAELTLDHIIPRSHGGKNGWINCISACKACNHKKADRTPKEAGMPLKFQPTEPRWTDSFHKITKNPNIRPNWMKFLSAVGV